MIFQISVQKDLKICTINLYIYKFFINLFQNLLLATFHHHLLLLSSQLLLTNLLLTLSFLLNSFFTLSQNHFNVTRMAHEGVDSTVSSVHSSSVLGGFVDGNVFNKQRINLQRFQFSVGFGISQKFQQVFAGLFGPSTLRGFETGARGELFGLSASAGRFVVSEEGNTSFVFDDVLQVLLSLSA